MNIKKFLKESLVITLISFITLVSGFSYLEPNITSAITDEHTVKQTITAEITFAAAANDITMAPELASVTGGTANGGTQFRIVSTNSTGFSVTINTDSDNGMEGEATSGTIPHITPAVAGVPDYTFSAAPANTAEFAYTINSSTTGEITQPFRNNGADTCGTGSTETEANCWLDATTTAFTIINRSTPTDASGATSTLNYRVIISANPSPSIPEDVYTATTTLTATNN